jgi:hypothetical protein
MSVVAGVLERRTRATGGEPLGTPARAPAELTHGDQSPVQMPHVPTPPTTRLVPHVVVP